MKWDEILALILVARFLSRSHFVQLKQNSNYFLFATVINKPLERLERHDDNSQSRSLDNN